MWNRNYEKNKEGSFTLVFLVGIEGQNITRVKKNLKSTLGKIERRYCIHETKTILNSLKLTITVELEEKVKKNPQKQKEKEMRNSQ